MEMIKTLTLMLFAAILLLLPKMEAQPFSRPLCVSQFALVNYACAMLPYIPLPPLVPPMPSLPPAPPSDYDEENRRGHSHGHGHGHDHHGHEQWPGQGHEHGRNHSHGQGQGRRHGHERKHGQEQSHGHRHRHRHRHAIQPESTEQANCCRWLNELDDECVCDLLVRLPPFLSRPIHMYNLYLDETCNVTYACEGRLLRP
ncbi:hypothetical protein P3X46_003091 [Hevea brasiliensis]|uniref:Bifunctional inhibitor/plant lipid transfer protein/seed storage helical domain-containing protein n=1 Tax=Hevea brasiliensis TaxID=3981 RepID=A0ABQ9N7D1_HEVBR|nr:uncharacterized protein LOC110665492 [Hevea brasiliensis]KAJ9187663.1 hypothetical protein P3X46_003091 [Hevea brasiliensis]